LDWTLLILFVAFLFFGLGYLILILVYRARDSPPDTFTYLKTLLGGPSDAPVVTYHAQIASSGIAESARRTIDFVQAEGTKWAVEELVAMKFAYIKHLAELVANEKVTDVVVVVPHATPNSNATPSPTPLMSPVFVPWPSPMTELQWR
jgi:hypothetical protein